MNYLTSADQEGSDWLVENIFLIEAETTIRLGIKPQFGDMGLAQMTPFKNCCLIFNTITPFRFENNVCLNIASFIYNMNSIIILPIKMLRTPSIVSLKSNVRHFLCNSVSRKAIYHLKNTCAFYFNNKLYNSLLHVYLKIQAIYFF